MAAAGRACLVMAVMMMMMMMMVTATSRTSDGAEIVFKPCKTAGIPKCKVKTVSVDGCQKERSHEMNHIPSNEKDVSLWRRGLRMSTCDVSKRSHLNFTISVYSGFAADSLSSQFTLVTPRLDCSPEGAEGHCLFREYVRNGCRSTSCPLGVDSAQRVTDSLKINPDSNISKRVYTGQWKLWNKSNKKENCCFTFKLLYY